MKNTKVELKDIELEAVTGGELGGTNELIIGIQKNTHNGNALSDDDLENVGAGTAPELPATKLEKSEYSGMFSNSQGLGEYEIHLYNGGIADHDSFTAKIKENENE